MDNGNTCKRNLRALVLTALLLAFGRTPAVGSHASHPVPPLALDALPLLFADDSGVLAKRGVVRTVHPARTRPAPVLIADRPWEGQRVYVYGTVGWNPTTRRFQMWYMAAPDPQRGVVPQLRTVVAKQPSPIKRVPSLPNGGRTLVLYAESSDGLHWTKPTLGLHAYMGSAANNILLGMSSPSVWIDDDAPAERRYLMMGKVGGGYHAAYSADGVRWTLEGDGPVMRGGDDTLTLSRDPRTGAWLLFHKHQLTVRGFNRRSVMLARSADARSWSEPELVFATDEADDQWAGLEVGRTDVYNLAVFPHAAGFLGFPTIFRVIEKRAQDQVLVGQSGEDGPIDVQLATSGDGRTWARSWPRLAIISRGPPGSYDGGAILGVSNLPVHAGRESWLYYTAINTGHGAAVPPKEISIGRAEWRLHGFASLDADAQGGRIETVPLRVVGGMLKINADASRGSLRVALREADGRPIPGYELKNSPTLREDATDWEVRWAGCSIPTDRAVRVVVAMSQTRLFSLYGRGAEPVKD